MICTGRSSSSASREPVWDVAMSSTRSSVDRYRRAKRNRSSFFPSWATKATTAARAAPSVGIPIGSDIHQPYEVWVRLRPIPRYESVNLEVIDGRFLVQQGGVDALRIGEPHGQGGCEPPMERGGCGRLLGLQSLDRVPAEGEHHAWDLGD